MDNPQALQLLRTMYTIRGFELKMLQLFQAMARAGESVGALHSCEGQEAICAGVGACLRKDDYQFSTHRGHGHAIAKGLDLKRLVAEMLGKATGCSHGRGGSMHLFDVEIGLLGGNGIVGGGLPLALGAGFSAVYRGTDQVTVCYFGDGAASQGAAHESLNMAALHKLPIIYVCENNHYAATTHVSKNCPIENIADRARGYNMPGQGVEGNDVVAVFEAASEAVARARRGEGPTLLECKTYRHRPHCMVIPEHRPEEERKAWMARDPIDLFVARLRQEQVVAQADVDRLAAEVEEELVAAVRFAQESPLPDPQTVADGLWAHEEQATWLC
jgi:pyruvate dehydrogenase E1 component alpha subunit